MSREIFHFLIQPEVEGAVFISSSPAPSVLIHHSLLYEREFLPAATAKWTQGLCSSLFILLPVMRSHITYLMPMAVDISWGCFEVNLPNVSQKSPQDLIIVGIWLISLSVCKIHFIMWIMKDKSDMVWPMDNKPYGESQFKWIYICLFIHGPEIKLCLEGSY